MRDVLTILASLVIVVLAAVLAVPPLVDWPAHRAWVDRAITRAVGTDARTEGALEIRLLPSPRIRMDRLRLGSGQPDSARLDAMFVKAELALTNLLSGEVRFLDTRVGRAEIRLPTGSGGDWRVPPGLAGIVASRRAWAFEDASVLQFLVTTLDPRTGRTDQAYAENVRIQAGSFAGPWRLEGTTSSVPFQVSVGEFGEQMSAPVKVGAGGGAGRPRLDIDARLDLQADPDGSLRPRLAGTGRFATSLPGAPAAGGKPVPASAQASLKTAGRTIELENLAVEIGEGLGAARLGGTGSFRVDEPRLALNLAGRRVDLAVLKGPNGAAAWGAIRNALAAAPLPVDLAARLDTLSFGPDDEWAGVALSASLDPERLAVSDISASGPGRSTLRASGEVSLGERPIGSGRIVVAARDGERFGRMLEGLGLRGSLALVGDRPIEAAADVTASDLIVSLRNARLSVGDASLSGTLRYDAPEPGARARLEAQLAVQGIDVAALPEIGPAFAGLGQLDVAVTLDARNVAYGPTARGGRISGRVATDGTGLVVERLEVRDLAGAEADLSGRIAPDGTGRIEGRLRARQAAPLADLFGRAWLGGLARLLPDFARASPIDLAVVAERVAPAGGSGSRSSLRTRLTGSVAGGPFEAQATTTGDKLSEVEASASTDNGGLWLLGRDEPAARKPGRVRLAGRRDASGRLALDLDGDLAGFRIRTVRPVLLGGDDDRLEGAELDTEAADASALLKRFGIQAAGPVPVKLRVSVSRTAALKVSLTGEAAGTEIGADLLVAEPGAIEGSARIGRISVPALASALALNVPATTRPGEVWSSARFGAREPLPFGGSLRIAAARLDLGSGFSAVNASFVLATRPDGFRLGELDAAFADGRLKADIAFDRQGGLASVVGEGSLDGVRLDALLGAPFRAGRIAARLRFGGSGESAAGITSNLGGVAEGIVSDVRVAAADPAAVGRVAATALRSDGPLSSLSWQPLLAEELGKRDLAADQVRIGGSMIAGALRLGPVAASAEAGSWQGTAIVDLRNGTMDARGTLQSAATPRLWVGPPPAVGLGWSGPVARPTRTIDPGPLVNGLAAVVLARELDRIETFELDAAERQRRNSRVEMERQRRIAAEEAERRRREEERVREAERQRQEMERQRQETEQRRLEAERAREAERQRLEAERRRREEDRVREAERQRQEAERRRREAEERKREEERRAGDSTPVEAKPREPTGN